MNNKHVEARILKKQGDMTTLLIRAGDSVVQANYTDLIPCEFPVWTGSPVNVEVPSGGVRHHVTGLSSEDFLRKHADGGLPNMIKFPAYTQQAISTPQAFDSLPSTSYRKGTSSVLLSREPVVAIAVSASGYMQDGKRVETHAVLPIWNDGTAVVVTLNWYDGEPGEGMPNPEWYLRGTDGMPLEMGLKEIRELSLLPAWLTDCSYRLAISPYKLGQLVFDSVGQPVQHRVWQNEWQYSNYTEFQAALECVSDQLLGLSRAGSESVAGQRA